MIMAKVQIVYGTTGGNTELVCEAVRSTLVKNGHVVNMDRCEHFSENNLTGHDLLILASPTYGHGQLEDHLLRTFWPRVQDVDLQGQHCAIIGLGDPKYDDDYNIESAKILREWARTHNGVVIQDNLSINLSPVPQLETKVRPWAEKLSQFLK